jgi:hypothetical protein
VWSDLLVLLSLALSSCFAFFCLVCLVCLAAWCAWFGWLEFSASISGCLVCLVCRVSLINLSGLSCLRGLTGLHGLHGFTNPLVSLVCLLWYVSLPGLLFVSFDLPSLSNELGLPDGWPVGLVCLFCFVWLWSPGLFGFTGLPDCSCLLSKPDLPGTYRIPVRYPNSAAYLLLHPHYWIYFYIRVQWFSHFFTKLPILTHPCIPKDPSVQKIPKNRLSLLPFGSNFFWLFQKSVFFPKFSKPIF